MTKETTKQATSMPPITAPEQRFPKAAVDYIDALLDVQRQRFEAEQATALSLSGATADWPALSKKLEILAESDNFVGSGWGELDHTRKGAGRRWMARLGTLLLSADLSSGGMLKLVGGGYLRRRYVDELTVWIDNMPIEGVAIRKGRNSWFFEGPVPALPARPFHILGLQTKGLRHFVLGPDTHASVALSEVHFNG